MECHAPAERPWLKCGRLVEQVVHAVTLSLQVALSEHK